MANKPIVSTLLAQSRSSHDAKKRTAGLVDGKGVVIAQPDYPMAEAHIVAALVARLDAHDLDPKHADPAWATDEAANNKQTDAQMIKFFVAYALVQIPQDVMVKILTRFPEYRDIKYIP